MRVYHKLIPNKARTLRTICIVVMHKTSQLFRKNRTIGNNVTSSSVNITNNFNYFYCYTLVLNPLEPSVCGFVVSLLTLCEPEGLNSAYFTLQVPARPGIDCCGWHMNVAHSSGGLPLFYD